MRLYISGPITAVGPPTWNFPAFDAAESSLRAVFYDVVNPAAHGIIAGYTWADYLKMDLKLLLDCDGVAVLPRWDESRGALLEVHVAEALGLSVHPVGVWLAWAGA